MLEVIESADDHRIRRRQNAMASRLLLLRMQRVHGDEPEPAPEPVPEILAPISNAEMSAALRCIELGTEELSVPRVMTIRQIQQVTNKHFGITKEQLFQRRRTKAVVFPRHIGIYFAKQLTKNSYPEIGRRFGDMDHTSVMYAVKKIEREIKTDWRVAYDVAHIESAIAHWEAA